VTRNPQETGLAGPERAELKGLADIADLMADAAARETLPRFRQHLGVENKLANSTSGNTFDPVTEADRRAESVMRELLATHYEQDGIIGEEFGHRKGSSEREWILDPIDGTRAFITGVPQWGTLIGVRQQSKPVFGLVDQPFLGERYTGSALGAFRQYRGKPRESLIVRSCPLLSEAVMLTTSPDMFDEQELSVFEQLRHAVKMSRFGGDCYAYCMLASGFVDLVVESDLQAYDIQPLIPIIEAAGGIVSNWSGEPLTAGGQVIAAGDSSVHEAAVALLGAGAV